VSERYPKNETVANSINTTILFSMARDAKGLKVALVVWVGDEPQLHSVMDFERRSCATVHAGVAVTPLHRFPRLLPALEVADTTPRLG
jgi:hypothetical protein